MISERLLARVVLNYTRGDQDDGSGMNEPADRVPPLNGRLSLRMHSALTLGRKASRQWQTMWLLTTR